MSETRKRRSYDETFKRDAVRLVVEEGYSFARAPETARTSSISLRRLFLIARIPPARSRQGGWVVNPP